MYVSLLKTVVLAGSEFSIRKFNSCTPKTKLLYAPILVNNDTQSVCLHAYKVCIT